MEGWRGGGAEGWGTLPRQPETRAVVPRTMRTGSISLRSGSRVGALELHPQNIVFNTADVHKLIELTGATHVGVELDASHLFWQQMDPVAVVRALSPRLSPEENRTNLGGDEWANEWPKDSAWDFVALGRGHNTAYWTEFLRALYEVDPDMLVNIEHEDTSLGRIEGLQVAAKVLRDADAALSASLHLTN